MPVGFDKLQLYRNYTKVSFHISSQLFCHFDEMIIFSNPFLQLEMCFRNIPFPAVITMMEHLLSSK